MKKRSIAKTLIATAVFAMLVGANAFSAFASEKLEAPTNLYWSNKSKSAEELDEDGKEWDEGSIAHWDAVENAKKYEIYLYCDDAKKASITTSKTYCNLRSYMTSDGEYTFKVRCLKHGSSYTQSAWSEFSDEYYANDTSASSNESNATTGGPNSSTQSTNTSVGYHWSGFGDEWHLFRTDGNGFLANSWYQDTDGNWYLIGCMAGIDEGTMNAGLFQDDKGDYYLLNPNHDGTYGRLLTGDSNGNLHLSYNGSEVDIQFSQVHDGTFGKIISGLDALKALMPVHQSIGTPGSVSAN